MSIFEIIFYISVILLSFSLSPFIFLKRKTKDAEYFSLAIFFAGIWVTLVFLFFYLSDQEIVLWLGRATFAMYLMILLSLCDFVAFFPSPIKTYNKSINLVIKITTIIVAFITIFTPLVIKEEIITGAAQRDTIYGPLYWLWIAFFAFLFGVILFFTYKQYKKTEKGVEKKQIFYALIGTSFAILVGFFLVVIAGLLGFQSIERIGVPIGLVIFFSFTSYSVLKHRFMDINVATGRVATYLLTFLTIGFFGYMVSTLSSNFNISQNYQVIFSALLAGILFKPLFAVYERFSSRYLYYSFYSSQKVLEELSGKLTKILDIDELADLTTKTIMDTMKLDRAVILLRDEKTGKFDIKRNFGFKEENGISLVTDNFLTKHLKETNKPLVYEELSLMINSTDKETEKEEIKKLQNNMKRIEAALCNLLISKDEVIGMIVLGEKISKDPYTHQDVELLDSLCKQISISLQNAKLYSEVQDFSENLEKKVDEQVKELKVAYKKLQRLDKIKTEFMSIVSHQLRTPLSIIKGHLSMIEEGVYDNNEERRKEILTNVYKANERLITLVNDVLNISRIQSGKVEIHKEETSIEKIIEETIEKMQKPAEDKGVKITFSKPKEDIPLLNIDTNKIENILINLIDNALKYTPQGEITISLQKEEKDIKIEIKDTGDGMTKEEIEKLFETFSRGEAGKKHWIQGSGLGLYIAKQFVEMHEGKIWATSEGEGKGSQFYITLPF